MMHGEQCAADLTQFHLSSGGVVLPHFLSGNGHA